MIDNFTKDELIRYVENTLSELKLVCLDFDDDDYDELLENSWYFTSCFFSSL